MLNKMMIAAILFILTLIFSGCYSPLFGDERGHPISEYFAEQKAESRNFHRSQHFYNHWRSFFDGVRDMHKFWDRHFMNYDWDNPYYD